MLTGLRTDAADGSDNWHFWHAGAPDPSILLWTPGNPVASGGLSVAPMTATGLVNGVGTSERQFFCEIQIPSKR